MIANIRAYSATTKIGIMLTTPPNASQDAFGTAHGWVQTQWRYRLNNYELVKRAMARFIFRTKIYLIPTHQNIDAANNINDGVHPKTAGYNEMGDTVYYWLKSFET